MHVFPPPPKCGKCPAGTLQPLACSSSISLCTLLITVSFQNLLLSSAHPTAHLDSPLCYSSPPHAFFFQFGESPLLVDFLEAGTAQSNGWVIFTWTHILSTSSFPHQPKLMASWTVQSTGVRMVSARTLEMCPMQDTFIFIYLFIYSFER